MVPKVGFEPTRGLPHSLLRRACLPFHHFGTAKYMRTPRAQSSKGPASLIVPDDERLVNEAQKGNIDSFNALVERYQIPVYNVALRQVGDHYMAEEVAQEAFVAAWRAIRSFKGGSFRAWLFRITVNEARDLYRKNSRRSAGSLDKLIEEGRAAGFEQPGPRPDQIALSASTLRTVEGCIRQLPEDQRLVILLSDVQGLSYEEVSQALDIPLGTVKSRLNRGRITLRKLLTESGEL